VKPKHAPHACKGCQYVTTISCYDVYFHFDGEVYHEWGNGTGECDWKCLGISVWDGEFSYSRPLTRGVIERLEPAESGTESALVEGLKVFVRKGLVSKSRGDYLLQKRKK
jgi:hypothetical protein